MSPLMMDNRFPVTAVAAAFIISGIVLTDVALAQPLPLLSSETIAGIEIVPAGGGGFGGLGITPFGAGPFGGFGLLPH